MSTTSFRRRIPAISSTSNNHTRHILFQSPHRRTPSTNRTPSKPSKFTRCSSEPNLWTTAITSAAADRNFSSEKEGEEVVIFRPHTFSEAFASSPLLIPSTDQLLEVRAPVIVIANQRLLLFFKSDNQKIRRYNYGLILRFFRYLFSISIMLVYSLVWLLICLG